MDEKKRRIIFEDNMMGGKWRSFILFSDTRVSEGGWCGRKWLTAKELIAAENRWATYSYSTRADAILKEADLPKLVKEQLRHIDDMYDLTAGCAQCGGCSFFAAIDGDYGICCNPQSRNDGRVTFEHGGCIDHSFIQELLSNIGLEADNALKEVAIPLTHEEAFGKGVKLWI